MQIDDIKDLIYKSLDNYSNDDLIIKIERCFIDDFNKKIVVLISENSSKDDHKVYYYGFYDIYSESAIQQNSQQYSKLNAMLPTAGNLCFDTLNFMENRKYEKREATFIEEYISEKKCGLEYIELLKDERANTEDKTTFEILTYFIKDNAIYDAIEKDNNDSEDVISYTTDNTEIMPISMQINVNNDKNKVVKKETKKNSHTELIFILTIIGSLLGLLSAFMVIGFNNVF